MTFFRTAMLGASRQPGQRSREHALVNDCRSLYSLHRSKVDEAVASDIATLIRRRTTT
jgi:hypothetical protein